MRHLVILLCSLVSAAALAGPLEEKKADAHLKAVAAGDIEVLMRDYVDDAYMDWVGGPLDGRYRGKAAIREVWKKWATQNDGKPRQARFGKLSQYANPKGVSVETSAEYSGKATARVWHLLVYREGELATEIWQIDPALKVGE